MTELGMATIADLNPFEFLDLASNSIKNDMRMQGSFQLLLKRPSKLPEYSRQYTQGDPIQLIDWKAYARNDQLIIQQKRNESGARVVIAIEATETMNWAPEIKKQIVQPPKKMEIACRIAMHLAFLHTRMGDYVQLLFVLEDAKVCELRMKNGADVKDLFNKLLNLNFNIEKVVAPSFVELSSQVDIAYWIGDLLNGELYKEHFQRAKYQCMFHTLSSLEMSTDWMESDQCFFDESNGANEKIGKDLMENKRLLAKVHNWSNQLKQECLNSQWEYLMVHDHLLLGVYFQFIGILSRERKSRWK